MSGPFLIGARVQLRPCRTEDAPLFADWMNDPEIRHHLPIRRFPLTLEEEKEWLVSMRCGTGAPRNIVLAIEQKRGGRLIGTVGLHAIDWVHRRAMSGSFIGPVNLRGKGLGTEAKTLILNHAFSDLGMESIWSYVVEDNAPSIQALKKQGYTQNGRFRHCVLIGGRWRDCLYFDLLRVEWEHRQTPETSSAPAQRTRTRTGGSSPRS